MILTIYTATTMIVLAYVLGSIPSAVWIGKKYYGIDIREHGSKNAGTTNMLRVLGRGARFRPRFLEGLRSRYRHRVDAVRCADRSERYHQPEDRRCRGCRAGAYFPCLRRIPRRQGSRYARRSCYRHLSARRFAVLRRVAGGADDFALCVARVDDRRVLFPGLHAHFAQGQRVDRFRGLLVRDRRSVDRYPPKEHQAVERRHRIENLYLEAAERPWRRIPFPRPESGQ